MPARLGRQPRTVKAAWEARLSERMTAQREAALRRALDRLPPAAPGLLRTVVRWGAAWAWASDERRNTHRGREGEQQLVWALRWRLSAAWWIIPDVILHPRDDLWAQIDLLAIGPPGLFVIEVKHWQGAVRAVGDRWTRKAGRHWVSCESPTRQNSVHVQVMQAWWRTWAPPGTGPEAIFPVVAIFDTAWLRVDRPTMPVFDRPSAVARHLVDQPVRWPPAFVNEVAARVTDQAGLDPA